jgi:acetyltransferase-like isoleucine patch superfamily enzyme
MRIGPRDPRRGIYLGTGVQLFDDVRLVLGAIEQSPWTDLRIGSRTVINVGCYVSGEGGLEIGEDVLIGAHGRILSAGHAIHHADPRVARNPLTHAPVVIGSGAWLGAGNTVLQGVRIGEGAVVGAGSVVTRDIPPYAVAAGNPARVKHYRKGHEPHRWWTFWKA